MAVNKAISIKKNFKSIKDSRNLQTKEAWKNFRVPILQIEFNGKGVLGLFDVFIVNYKSFSLLTAFMMKVQHFSMKTLAAIISCITF